MATPRSLPPWTVLGLDPAWFAAADSSSFTTTKDDNPTRAALVRRAYRRALLQHHPDKQAAVGGNSSTSTSKYTVDEIKAAYAALGGGASSSSSSSKTTVHLGDLAAATGLEVVDLDELPFDEVVSVSSPGTSVQQWYRSCRCGNPRGFTFDEHDLEEELDAEAMEALAGGGGADGNSDGNTGGAPATGELMVGCQDCSLWLCVHFAAAPDDDDDDADGSIEGDDD